MGGPMADRPDRQNLRPASPALPPEVLGQAMAALTAAWTDRSDAEKSAVADRFTRTAGPTVIRVDPGPPIAARPLERVRYRGALSGSVRPAHLVAGIEVGAGEQDRGTPYDVLALAAGDFDRVVTEGQMRWTMRGAARAGLLRRLVAAEAGQGRPTLVALLADARSVPTDPTGELLRRITGQWLTGDPAGWAALRGQLLDRSSGEGKVTATVTSRDLVQALGWAGALPGVPEWLRLAERAQLVDSLIDSYVPLVAGGLVGRDAELARLRQVAELPRALLPWNGVPERGLPVLAVTGVGGVGKSTLVGHFVEPYLRAIRAGRPRLATVVVDLDRVAFRPHSEAELTYEVARQLACSWLDLADDIEQAVADSRRGREQRREYYQGSSADPETAGRAERELAHRLGGLIRGSGRATQTVLVVLDTFEEWQRERPFRDAPRQPWNDPEAQMAEWLLSLRHEMGLDDVRVVISGRAPVSDWPGFAALEPVQLDDLAPDDAAALLRWAIRELGIDDSALDDRFVAQLVEIVGRNPLTVRIAARFLAKLDPDERMRFVAEGAVEGSDQLDAEVLRAVLYDRFLGHVRDPDVQQLAHPGLALRRVTPELVEHVLAGPCGLTGVDAARATDLVERLADEVWLVTRDADGSLRHRSDVRRAMIRFMRADPDRAEQVDEVHLAAAAWYADPQRPPHPTPPLVEATYHRLMTETGSNDLDEQLRTYAAQLPELGEDVDDFHPAVAAQVRLQRGDALTPAQARHLPERHWRTYVEREGASWLHQDPAAAADLVLLREDLAAELDPPWLAQACWDSGRWGAYWRPTGPDVRMDGTRYGFLDALVSGAGPALARWEDAARRRIAEPASWEDAGADPAFFLLLAGGPAAVLQGRLPPTRRNPDQPTADQLRSLVARTVWGGDSEDLPRVGNTAGLFVPDPVELGWVVESVSSAERVAEMVDELRELGARAREATPGRDDDGLRTYDLLNSRAHRFAKTLDTEVALRRPGDGSPWPSEAESRVLRGDNPEWRTVVRNELVRNAPDDQWLRTLGEIATAMLPVPAVDLRPQLQPLLSEPTSRTALVTLVEYVDRSRRLGPFLADVSARHPSSAGLRRLGAAFQTWDQAHWRLFAALREQPPW